MSCKVPAPPDPRRILAEAGLFAKKSFGQHFLLDQDVLAYMARLAVRAPGETIIELGAGLGALTHHLLLAGANVVAIERDRELVPLLRRALDWAGERLVVLERDAGKLDYEASAAEHGASTVAGNLPYNIGSRIIVSLANARALVSRGVFLLQREVAERVVATAGQSSYGLLSVLVQRSFDAELVRVVSRHAFAPPPKVQSAVITLAVRAAESEDDEALVIAARAAFSARRKMLRSALATAFDVPAARLAPVFVTAKIDPTARAETLAVFELRRLGEALAAHGIIR